MDKDDIQHLEEYRAYLKALKIRVSTMENLIRPLAAQERVEGEVPTCTAPKDYDFDTSRNRVEND